MKRLFVSFFFYFVCIIRALSLSQNLITFHIVSFSLLIYLLLGGMGGEITIE